VVKRNVLDVNALLVDISFRVIDLVGSEDAFGDVQEDLQEFREGKAGREALSLYYELLISFWMVVQIIPAGIAAGVAILLGHWSIEWRDSIAALLGGVLIFFPAASAVIAAFKLLLAKRVIPEEGFKEAIPTRWQLAALPRAQDNWWALALAVLGSYAGWLFVR
jgi:hypothetical protein